MISRTSVTEEIVAYFKEKIKSGEWKVGEKIPSETQLTEILGVSRASVRTAIQHMIGVGVLESQHGRGTFLVDDQVEDSNGSEVRITADDCKDIGKVLEFRRIVESEGCYLATKNITEDLLTGLRESLKEMEDNKGHREQFVTADVRFHQIIARATGNSLLEKSTIKVFSETRKNHEQMNQLFGYEDGIHYHRLILEALENSDADGARKYMYEHLQNAIQKLGLK